MGQTQVCGLLLIIVALLFGSLLILNHNAIHFAGKGGAGVQGDDAVGAVGGEVCVAFEFAAIVLVTSMAEGTMPMAADDGFAGFNNSCVGGFHAVDPASLIPLLLACVAPIGDRNILLFGAAEAEGRAGDPAVDKNVMLGFEIIHHGGDDRLD